MEEIVKALNTYWGYNTFRPLQKEAMQCVREGRDSVVVLPTGGGKSLCFQTPAVTLPGFALVVSPLISLMKDQVDALTQCGVVAARLDSALDWQDRNWVFDRIANKTLKLLYLSPERLFSNGFIDFLKKQTISFVAVDEAHCISMWGHDFRPEYRQMGQLKTALPGIAIHGYTATATQLVRDDIAKQLHLDRPQMLIGSFDRPNLVYKAERADNLVKQIRSVLDRHKNESGIIYCIRRDDVNELCAQLCQLGYSALPYHAGMSDLERKNNQESFIQEKVNIIVATVAFGMGIDKSNVRYVIHSAMPKSLEHYQQESGRAGRDGLEAECILFYSGSDYGIWNSILSKSSGDIQKVARRKLGDMYDYCTGVNCRHRALLNYFGQELQKSNCAACDVCLDGLESIREPLITAQKILSCIVRLQGRFGAEYTTLVLTGSNDKRILDNQHNLLSTYNLLSEFDKKIVRDWIEQLVSQGHIQKSEEYHVLNVTEAGWRVIRGTETPRLLQPAKKTAKVSKVTEDAWQDVDRELFEALRVLRKEIAEFSKVPTFTVFSDASLRDMARRRPTTLRGFRKGHGVGESKAEKYGERFLAVIHKFYPPQPHRSEDDIMLSFLEPKEESRSYEPWSLEEEQRLELLLDEGLSTQKIAKILGRNSTAIRRRMKNLGLLPKDRVKENSTRENARTRTEPFFAEGRSLEEIARVVDRKTSTIVQYLVEYIRQHQILTPQPWVDPATDAKILSAVQHTGRERLRPIFDFLEEKVSFDDIRISIACLRNRERENQEEVAPEITPALPR